MHGYWSIDLEILHTTATTQRPSFAASLRTVLDTLTAEADQSPDATPAAAADQASTAEQPTVDIPAADR